MRRFYFWLAVLVMTFAIYASLLPFDLHVRPMADALSIFVAILIDPTSETVSRTNFLANVLLFVPIGFGLMGAQLAEHRRWQGLLGGVLVTVVASLLVSTAAEFLQVFAPNRVPALTDILAQTAGTIAGIISWTWAGPGLTAWLRASTGRSHSDRVTRALVGYCVVWIIAGLAPFDATLDIGELGHRLRTGMINVVPFASIASPQRQAWDALIAVVSAIPLGMLGLTGWLTQSTRRGAAAAWTIGATAVVTLEAAQIFIYSHAADITDVLFGSLGVAVGVLIGVRTVARMAASAAPTPAARTRWLVMVGLWCLVICGYHWLPFDFGVDLPLVQRKLSQISLVPFAGHWSGSDLDTFNNTLSKVAVAMPLGLFVALAAHAWRLSTRVLVVGWTAAAAVIFSIVEVGQLFVPSRVPDPTDVLLGIAASLAGLALGRWLNRKAPSSGARASLEGPDRH
jgi:glycopeptide antibiotics resistance protein